LSGTLPVKAYGFLPENIYDLPQQENCMLLVIAGSIAKYFQFKKNSHSKPLFHNITI
jgi:hypothetical protein